LILSIFPRDNLDDPWAHAIEADAHMLHSLCCLFLIFQPTLDLILNSFIPDDFLSDRSLFSRSLGFFPDIVVIDLLDRIVPDDYFWRKLSLTGSHFPDLSIVDEDVPVDQLSFVRANRLPCVG
jgi:hypothetical protein